MPRPDKLPRRDIDAEIAAARELLNGIHVAIAEATPNPKPRRRRVLVDGEWILADPPEPLKLRVLRERQESMEGILQELMAIKNRIEKADG